MSYYDICVLHQSGASSISRYFRFYEHLYSEVLDASFCNLQYARILVPISFYDVGGAVLCGFFDMWNKGEVTSTSPFPL